MIDEIPDRQITKENLPAARHVEEVIVGEPGNDPPGSLKRSSQEKVKTHAATTPTAGARHRPRSWLTAARSAKAPRTESSRRKASPVDTERGRPIVETEVDRHRIVLQLVEVQVHELVAVGAKRLAATPPEALAVAQGALAVGIGSQVRRPVDARGIDGCQVSGAVSDAASIPARRDADTRGWTSPAWRRE